MPDKQLREPAETTPTRPGRLSRKMLIALGVALLAAVVIAATLIPTTNARTNTSRSASATPSTSASPDSSPTPSESLSPSSPPGVDESEPLSPTAISEPGLVTAGVTASISEIEAVEGEATGPGEIAGPAVRFVVSMSNATDERVNLGSTVVTVYYGSDSTPAIELGEPGGSPLPAEVASGDDGSGTFVFSVPAEERGLVRIMVDYMVGVAPLVFEGPAPEA